MTSSPPISKSEEREPWWRRWLEPVVAGVIISTLLLSLVTVGVVAFQSLKGDLRDVDANLRETITATDVRLREAIAATDANLRETIIATDTRLREAIAATDANLKETIIATDTRLREAIAASETRLRDEMKEFKAEVRADMKDLKADMKDFKTEVKADNRALNEKLDRVLERLPAAEK